MMKKEIRWNKKMEKLLNVEGDKVDSVSFSKINIKDLLLPNFQKKYDCITIFDERSSMLTEDEFEKLIQKKYINKTNYEASHTETYLNYFMEGESYPLKDLMDVMLIIIDVWSYQLKQMEPESRFCFAVCCDLEFESVTMRFHKVREREPLWMGEDWESYEEPSGYIII